MAKTIQPNDKPVDSEKVDVEGIIAARPVKVATPSVDAPTPEEIMAKIAAAGASNDIAEVMRLGNQLKKHSVDIQKAEADRLKAEAVAMAGSRAKLAAELLAGLTIMDEHITKLAGVKATGFTFKLPYTDSNGVQTEAAVALSVPTIKTPKVGGGGGSTGALKSQTGLSRHELVEQYATDMEKQIIASAEAGATSRPDSARYIAEKPVIKRILADNPHLIKH